jgi:MscS family membrane protein
MSGWQAFFDRLSVLIHQAVAGNELWRFIASLGVLVIGFLILETLWRSANRQAKASVEKKGLDPEVWNLSFLLPPLRLAFTALLLRLAEVILVLPVQLRHILHGLETMIVALAIIILCFQLIALLDRLRLALPTDLQEEFPEGTLANLQSIVRITVIIAVAVGFTYTQKAIFPEWLWRYSWWRYLLIMVVIAIAYLAARLISKFLASMTAALEESEEQARMRLVLQAAIWPIRLILATVAVYAARGIFSLPQTVDRIAGGVIAVFSTLAVVLFVYRLLAVLEYELTKYAQREDTAVDQTFVQMVRIFTRVIVIAVGAIYLLRAISGKPMSALLAGLGIGGLAIALASQDTLKNFFGSIVIMLDKPFKVGQRVVVEGNDGVVEEIGFRSTRVRTLTGHLVTVPNEKMASANIENIGRRPHIRRLSNITITYDTPLEKVEKAVNIIRDSLDNHEGMDPDFPPRVYFNEFNDASLNIIMVYWYHPPDYWLFLDFSENVNLQIMREFEKEGIEFAFPTTTTYLAHDERRPLSISLSSGACLPGQRDSRE